MVIRYTVVLVTAVVRSHLIPNATIKYFIAELVGGLDWGFRGSAPISVAAPPANFLFLDKSLPSKNLLNPLKCYFIEQSIQMYLLFAIKNNNNDFEICIFTFFAMIG